MRQLAALLMLVCVGCATTQAVVHPPVIPETRRPEARDLPQDARTEALPEGISTTPGEDSVEAVEAGDPAPHAGILVSEARAVRDGIYRIRYTELRRTTEADRRVWTAHREFYEEQIRRDREALEEAQPDWWERNDGTILGVLGFVVGSAIVLGLAAAVDKVTD